jgi:hypothetical protein
MTLSNRMSLERSLQLDLIHPSGAIAQSVDVALERATTRGLARRRYKVSYSVAAPDQLKRRAIVACRISASWSLSPYTSNARWQASISASEDAVANRNPVVPLQSSALRPCKHVARDGEVWRAESRPKS